MFLKLFVAVLIIGSLITFVLYGADKSKAKRKAWRIPEKTLLLFGFLCGAAGALAAMHLFRHKTKHFKFMVGIPAIMVVQAAAIFALFYFGII